jgi:hypothetical protein
MKLDWDVRDRSGQWIRRLTLALLIGSLLMLIDLGFMASLRLMAWLFR